MTSLLRKWPLLVAIAVPWLLPTVVIALQLKPASVDLRGPWEWRSAEHEGAWAPLTLPSGIFTRVGIHSRDFFLRRTVSLPTAPTPAESWMLVLGDLRGAVARAWVNGHEVGDVGAFEVVDKDNYGGLDAIRVPAWTLQAGDNALQLELRTPTEHYSALADERLLIGPARDVAPWYLRTRSLETFFKTAPLLAFTFFAILMAVLAKVAATDRERRLALRTIAIAAGGSLYLWMHTGLGVTGVLSNALRLNLIITGVVVVVWSYFSFVMDYFEQPLRKLAIANRIISVAVLIASPILAPLVAYKIYAPWLLVLHGVMTVIMVRALRKRVDALTVLLTSGQVVFSTVGVADVLSDLAVLKLPRLFAMSLTNAPVVAGVVVIGTFIAISHRNRQLTASLGRSNEELATALVEAREATRVKSEFLANVSHELRTPLNSIINIPEGLLEDFAPAPDGNLAFTGDPDSTAHYLRTLHTSGVHLLGVVTQVLDFSKLEAGRMTLQTESVKVDELLSDVVRTLEGLAGKRRISLRVEGDRGGTFVADPVKVAQVLLNLGNNAVKFSPDGGTVTLGVKVAAGHVEFRVRDQGIGIAPEHLGAIFEGFRQVEGGSTRRFGGTGLGLSISRRLAALHGGSLTVESAPRQGSTFIATFPLEPGRPIEIKPARLDSQRPSVLVIDDEALVQETLRLSLRHLEVDVVPVEDPRLALETARSLRPALIILDVMMPRVSGLTLLRQLREDEALRRTPVIVLSAYPSNRELAVGMGARWLSKPWDPDELVALVRDLAGLDATGASPQA